MAKEKMNKHYFNYFNTQQVLRVLPALDGNSSLVLINTTSSLMAAKGWK
jgi:hypothetical protein